MANRGPSYGLSREVQDKIEQKLQCRFGGSACGLDPGPVWVTTWSDLNLANRNFQKWLMSGKVGVDK